MEYLFRPPICFLKQTSFSRIFSSPNIRNALYFFLSGKQSALPFDPFAASFFLVSRYEEYIPFIADEHNRFGARESFMFKSGFLDKPLVNQYAHMLGEILQKFNSGLELKTSQYKFINSVDIDNAYAYLGKGLVRTSGAFVNDLIKFRFGEIANRARTFVGLNAGPL